MNIDATVSAINRRVREITQTFGLNSGEYMKFKYQIESLLPDVLITNRRNEPLKISRSKKSLAGLANFETELGDLRKWMRGKTAYQMAKKYDTSGNYTKARFLEPQEQKRIRMLAVAEAAADNIIVDYYDAIDEISDTSAQLTARQLFSSVSQEGTSESSKMARYERAVNFIQDALNKQGAAIKSGTFKERTAAEEVASQSTMSLGDILRGLYKG